MRFRVLLVALLSLLASVPLAGAKAEHCSNTIYLFSYVSTPLDDPQDASRKLGNPTVTSYAIGCIVIGEDPRTPGHEFDSLWIYPGSDTLVVRWIPGNDDATGTLTFGGVTTELAFHTTTNSLTTVTDSQQITIDPLATLMPGTADITVCGAPDDCISATYRTLF